MSIQSQVGNIRRTAGDAISEVVNQASTRLENLFNSVTTGLGNL